MNKLIKLLLGAVITVSFSSCLKDKNSDAFRTGADYSNSASTNGIIELAVSQFSSANSMSMALDFLDVDTSVVFLTVRIAGGPVAPQDITVTIDTSVTQQLIDDYNLANQTALVAFDPSLFTIDNPGLTVTIPAGQREATVRLTVNPSTFDPSSTYALGFRIVSVSPASFPIAANYREFLTIIGAKNHWDGEYDLEWSNYHPTANPGYTGSSTTVHLVTTTSNTNKIYWPLAGEFANPAILNGGLTYFGSQEPEYTFDEVTKKVTVQNAFPGATTFYTMNPDYDSHYEENPEIEIFVKWGYNYVGGQFTLGTSREWTQHFTYTGPR